MIQTSLSGADYTASITSNVPFDAFPQPLKNAINNGQQPDWQKGFLNVTKAPYYASPEKWDNAGFINYAVQDAYQNNFVVFFPSGTYHVESGIQCLQIPPPGLNGNLKYCHVLAGSATGARSEIKLRNTATTSGVTTLFYFQYRDSGTSAGDPTRQYGATLRSLDIDMGNHPNADAISMEGAQNCAIEDVTVSGSFRAGINGIPGSGGSINNVTINGGSIGILSQTYRPNPVLAGVTLNGQSDYGVKITDSRGPVSLVGFDISSGSNASPSYRAVYAKKWTSSAPNNPQADLNLVDGRITLSGSAAIAIENSNQNLVIRNVYIKSPTLVKSGTGSGSILSGNATAYLRVPNYVFTTASTQATVFDENAQLHPPPGQQAVADYVRYDMPVQEAPPTDLVTRHTWTGFPSWQDSDIVDVTQYGATADNPADDDAPGINNAINYAKSPSGYHTVFLPRGHFHIKSPITLSAGINLIGGGKNISVLQMAPNWTPLPTATVNLLQTENSGTGAIRMQDFAILGMTPSTTGTTAPNYLKHVTLLNIQNADTILRDVIIHRYKDASTTSAEVSAPVVTIENNGGGKFYDLSLFRFGSENVSSPPPSYHLLHIRNTVHPIYLYSPSIEHWTKGGAQFQIDSAQNVHCIGLKCEGKNTLLQINNSSNCSVFGASGDFGVDGTSDDPSILEITGDSERLWFSLMDRHYDNSLLPNKMWISSGGISVTDAAPVALFKKGPPAIFAPGCTESFNDAASDFSGIDGIRYAYSGGLLAFRGSGTPPVYCNPRLIDLTNYQVSVEVCMAQKPQNSWDTPTLFFKKTELGAYTVRIKTNGSLLIQGPDITQTEVSASLFLNGGQQDSATNWNRITVQVNGTTAKFLINDKLVTAIEANGLSASGGQLGLTGRNGQPCFFDNFWYYQYP